MKNSTSNKYSNEYYKQINKDKQGKCWNLM